MKFNDQVEICKFMYQLIVVTFNYFWKKIDIPWYSILKKLTMTNRSATFRNVSL
jgi:hypothetical protein